MYRPCTAPWWREGRHDSTCKHLSPMTASPGTGHVVKNALHECWHWKERVSRDACDSLIRGHCVGRSLIKHLRSVLVIVPLSAPLIRLDSSYPTPAISSSQSSCIVHARGGHPGFSNSLFACPQKYLSRMSAVGVPSAATALAQPGPPRTCNDERLT